MTCPNKQHLAHLTVYGACMTCRRTLGPVDVEQKVFTRVQFLKEAGV